MVGLIRVLSPVNGLEFEEICSFETETKDFIGIWNHVSNSFVLVARSDSEFHLTTLPVCNDLDQLDKAVYDVCQEHIVGVSTSSSYEIIIEDNDEEYDGMLH